MYCFFLHGNGGYFLSSSARKPLPSMKSRVFASMEEANEILPRVRPKQIIISWTSQRFLLRTEEVLSHASMEKQVKSSAWK